MLFKKHHLFLLIVALLLAASFIFPYDESSATVLGNVSGLYGGPQFPSKAFNQAHEIDTGTDHPVVYIIDTITNIPTTLRCGDILDIKKKQNLQINEAASFTVSQVHLSFKPNELTEETINPSLAFTTVLLQSPDDSIPNEYYRIDNFTKPGIYLLRYEKEQIPLTTTIAQKTWSEPVPITVSKCSTTTPTQTIMNDLYNNQSIPLIYITTDENETPLTVLEGSIVDLKIKQKYPQDTEQEDTNYYQVTSVGLTNKKTSQTITDFKTIYVQHDEKTLQPYHRILIPRGDDHVLTYTLEHHYGANITGTDKITSHITTFKRPAHETTESIIALLKHTDDGTY